MTTSARRIGSIGCGTAASARDQVAKTYDDLIKASQDVARDEVNAVQAAEKNFDRAVKDVPDDATLTQAVGSLRDEAAYVQAAVSDLQTAAKKSCFIGLMPPVQ